MIGHAAALILAAAVAAGESAPCDEAVVAAAQEGMTAVQAQHAWLRKTFGGGAPVRQVLGASSDGKRRYDLVLWRKPDGATVEVCFDVTTVFEETIRRIEDGDTHRAPR